MKAKTINEVLNFERGKDPKEALKLGVRIKSLDRFNELLRIYNGWVSYGGPEADAKNNEIISILFKKLMLDPDKHITLDMIERCFDIVNSLETELNRIPKERISSYDYNQILDLINYPLKESMMEFINSQIDYLENFSWALLPKPDYSNLDRWGTKIVEKCIKTFKELSKGQIEDYRIEGLKYIE